MAIMSICANARNKCSKQCEMHYYFARLMQIILLSCGVNIKCMIIYMYNTIFAMLAAKKHAIRTTISRTNILHIFSLYLKCKCATIVIFCALFNIIIKHYYMLYAMASYCIYILYICGQMECIGQNYSDISFQFTLKFMQIIEIIIITDMKCVQYSR